MYEPESEPSVQVRLCETDEHTEPYGTVEDWYAVTDEPFWMERPLKVHWRFTARAKLCQPSEPPEPSA